MTLDPPASELSVRAIKTQIFRRGENLVDFILQELQNEKIPEETILVVTSKLLSLAENRVVISAGSDKEEVVRNEADEYLGPIGHGCHLTIKHGLLIASAGIDESNCEEGDYLLFPEKPFESAEAIYRQIIDRLGLKNFGVLITDSRTAPLRRGVTGVALAYYGFRGIRSMVGKADLFGRPLKMTQVNIADSLASAAVLLMGEANESCPLALIRCTGVDFLNGCDREALQIPLEEDLYAPLLEGAIERARR